MQILAKYRLFIFDWDHTLTTSTLLVTLLGMFNRQERSDARHYAGVYMPDAAIRKIRIRERINKAYAVLDDAYSVVFRPKLKQDAIQLLAFLKKHRKKIAIFSDSRTYRLLSETKKLGVLPYVDYELSAEAIDYYKPNPAGILLLADRFRTDKSKCLYIGDMASDVLTAKFAGVDSCALSDGVDTHAKLRNTNPTYVFNGLEAFTKAVEEKDIGRGYGFYPVLKRRRKQKHRFK